MKNNTKPLINICGLNGREKYATICDRVDEQWRWHRDFIPPLKCT